MTRNLLSNVKLFLVLWGWFGLIVLSFAGLKANYAFVLHEQAKRLKVEALVTEARVVEKFIRRSDKSRTEYIVYSFETIDGVQITIEHPASKARYDAAFAGKIEDIRYLREQPSVNEVVFGRTQTRSDNDVLFTVILLTFGITTTGLSLFRTLRIAQVRNHGEERRAKVTDHIKANIRINGFNLYRLCWLDETGRTGRSLARAGWAFNGVASGDTILVYADPQDPARSYWEGDCGKREPSTHATAKRLVSSPTVRR